ncbi:MAG: septum formation inhibitor Maf [Deltaproteobacteria bacterium]|nr:septum formation inhibitor Maf [Deltaproteobacteria bacterium]
MEFPEIVLASTSPRRRYLLELAGLDFRVQESAVAEAPGDEESPHDFVRRAARHKAQAVAAGCALGTWVLGADTVVVVDEEVFGKPADRDDARRMLRALSGRSHLVLTAVCLEQAGEATEAEILSQTEVAFRPLEDGIIEGYLDTGEPADKAGAYGIQGRGALLVRSISGSYTNVVGLPLCETVQMLEQAGVFRPFATARQTVSEAEGGAR